MSDQQKDNTQPAGQGTPTTPNQNGLSWTHFAPASTNPTPPKQPVSTPAATPPTNPSTPSVAKYVGIFAGGVVVGVLMAWGYSTTTERSIVAGPNATSTSQTAQAGSAVNGLVIGADGSAQKALEVASPQPAGKSVAIAQAIVTKPTWIIVYENIQGQPGRALGASLYSSKKKSGTVTLLRATVAGKSYFVGQAIDDGNNTFSLKTDRPVISGDKRLLVEFTAN